MRREGVLPTRVWLTRVVMVPVFLVAAVCAGVGVGFVVEDLEDTGDVWHGLGALFGTAMLVGGVMAAVLAVLAFRLVERRPTVARLLTSALAFVAAAFAYPIVVDRSWGWLVSPLPLLLAAAALLPERSAG